MSADGGSTAIALHADGTRIDGGVPLLTNVLIPQEEYTVKYNAGAAGNIGRIAIGITGDGFAKFLNISSSKDTPPYSSSSGKIGLPIALANLNGNILVTEQNSLPAGAVPLYFEAYPSNSAIGSGFQFGKIFADLNSVVPGLKHKNFEDEYGRIWVVYNKSNPSSDDRLSPLYINPAAVGSNNTGILSTGLNPPTDVYFMSLGGGYIRSTGQDNTLPIYIDVGATDPAACLYYDNAGSGVDVNIVAGLQNSQSEGQGVETTYFLVTTQIYFDETQTDPALRFFHRLSLAQRTIPVPMGGTDGLVLEVQYDATGTKGVPVYYKRTSFPAEFQAVNASLGDATFKTSSTRKLYQSNTD